MEHYSGCCLECGLQKTKTKQKNVKSSSSQFLGEFPPDRSLSLCFRPGAALPSGCIPVSRKYLLHVVFLGLLAQSGLKG